MIIKTLGASLGGATLGAHHVLESVAFSLITPPNAGSGAGSCFPLMVVVALGEPRVPSTSTAVSGNEINTLTDTVKQSFCFKLFRFIFSPYINLFIQKIAMHITTSISLILIKNYPKTANSIHDKERRLIEFDAILI